MKQVFTAMGLILLLIQPIMSQTDSTRTKRISGVERRLMEIKKIVTLSSTQEETLKTAYTVYQQENDSILFKVADSKQAAILKYRADKQIRETLMATLTEEQRIQYLTVQEAPYVMAKAEAKVELLRESGQYSEQELTEKQQEIFEYLMNEQIVYQRDRYNVSKLRDNIQNLRKVQPSSLRESDTREKLKVSGRINNGKIKW